MIKNHNEGNDLGFVSIPKEYKSRKQIVDTFVTEIQSKLNEMVAKDTK